ncbi:hypothetical protein GGX14DRAFT_678323 [Mycena pura]|uniref:Uncharacterized protein n=1 Tax=Mycena pura TaxID=153505 RepID=A0AAD6Y584_9AGAR|nr:hypothetical protein GGX14DRAFT_678323 [Mycena pura]
MFAVFRGLLLALGVPELQPTFKGFSRSRVILISTFYILPVFYFCEFPHQPLPSLLTTEFPVGSGPVLWRAFNSVSDFAVALSVAVSIPIIVSVVAFFCALSFRNELSNGAGGEIINILHIPMLVPAAVTALKKKERLRGDLGTWLDDARASACRATTVLAERWVCVDTIIFVAALQKDEHMPDVDIPMRAGTDSDARRPAAVSRHYLWNLVTSILCCNLVGTGKDARDFDSAVWKSNSASEDSESDARSMSHSPYPTGGYVSRSLVGVERPSGRGLGVVSDELLTRRRLAGRGSDSQENGQVEFNRICRIGGA